MISSTSAQSFSSAGGRGPVDIGPPVPTARADLPARLRWSCRSRWQGMISCFTGAEIRSNMATEQDLPRPAHVMRCPHQAQTKQAGRTHPIAGYSITWWQASKVLATAAHSHLPTLSNTDLLTRLIVLARPDILHLPYDIHAVHHFAEDHVFPI